MDYELMMNGNVKIGQPAPGFNAISTMGNINLNNYKGKWIVLFSHPGDFTPVCTTEMIAFANANTYFNKINTCLIGLSIDSNPSHMAWMYDIYCKTGIVIPFPIIADRSGEIARKYGMISNMVSNTSTVRNVFIIDDKQIVRTILVYPMNIGRNIPEILRIVRALQVADANNQMAPANWMPNEPMIVPMPQTFAELQARNTSIMQQRNGMSWYLSFKNPTNVCISSGANCPCTQENRNEDSTKSSELNRSLNPNTSQQDSQSNSKSNLSKPSQYNLSPSFQKNSRISSSQISAKESRISSSQISDKKSQIELKDTAGELKSTLKLNSKGDFKYGFKREIR